MRLLHLRLFLRSLLFLLAVTWLGKAAFAVYHRELFGTLSLPQQAYALLWGLRFDLALAAAFALLAFLAAHLVFRLAHQPLQRPLRWFTLAGALLLIGLHGGDTLYFSEAGRHLGYELKDGANSAGELARMALFSYTATLIAHLIAMVIAGYAGWRLLASDAMPVRPTRWWQHLAPEGQLFAVLLLAALAVRGGWQAVPMEPLHAQQIGNGQQATLALNGVYNALFSSVTPYAIRPLITAAPTPEQLALVRAMYADYAPQPLPRPEVPYNVVILFLESWSAAWMASYGHDQVTTPFFDELRAQSLTTHGMLAGGHRTTEGLFATLCSAQNPLGQTVAQSQLQNYSYRCLTRHPVIDCIGRSDLKQLLALLQRGTVLLAPDAGPAHLATAVGTPVIGLYACTNPARARPYLSAPWTVDRYADAVQQFRQTIPEQLPFGSRVRDARAMALITAAEVQQRLDGILAAPRGTP